MALIEEDKRLSMQTTEDIRLDTRFFCLFKGDPGAGKSIAAASYPGHKEKENIGPYFIDNDVRMKSVINYWRPRGREFHFDQFETFLDTNKRLEDFMKHGCPYRTIVYDGITTGSEVILNDMIVTRPATSKKVTRGGIEFLQIEDYGGEMRGLITLINNLKYISVTQGTNVIVTAHVLTTETYDIKTRVTTESRSLLTAGKKVAARLPVDFDEAYHFDVQPDLDITKMPRYTILTHNVGRDWAKTALPLPLRLDFTDASLYEKIMEQLVGRLGVHSVNDLSNNDLSNKSLEV